jgi:hypothetical protein
MKQYILLIFFLITIYLFGIIDVIFIRNYKRYKYFILAKNKSFETKKKLLVVGCPNNGGLSSYIGNIFNVYNCGDIVIDIDDCMCSNHIKSDIYDYLKNRNTNEYVIFISVTLEYIKNIEEVIKEILRVSGGDVYIVNIEIPIERLGLNLGKYNKYIRYWRIKGPPQYDKITFQPI